MGIESVITCDNCSRTLKDEDYATVEIKIETDFNFVPMGRPDVRERIFKLYCLNCAETKIENVKTVVKANG